jgi:hypothetical protein
MRITSADDPQAMATCRQRDTPVVDTANFTNKTQFCGRARTTVSASRAPVRKRSYKTRWSILDWSTGEYPQRDR